MAEASTNTEAELEVFRQRWRDEVSARNARPTGGKADDTEQRRKSTTAPPPAAHIPQDDVEEDPQALRPFHDEAQRNPSGQNHDRDEDITTRSTPIEPSSALEHYEHAVERETQGSLGDSVKHYRQAYRLDDGVHEAYKQKHFPPSAFVKPKSAVAASAVKGKAPAASQVPRPVVPAAAPVAPASRTPLSLPDLISSFSNLSILPAPPETDLSPELPCYIASLPEELLAQILTLLATKDLAAFARTAQVCKRLAYLVNTEDSIWKRVALGNEIGFGAMLWEYACDIEGQNLSRVSDLLGDYSLHEPSEQAAAFVSTQGSPLLNSSYPTHRQLLRLRPRIRFTGVYISTVNYNRPGAASTTTSTWGTAPVHIVTYFRYLRFFRDGSVISLLTTTEPGSVVEHLTRENLHARHHTGSQLPSAVMKDALRGRWRLSSPTSGTEGEVEGDVHIETLGVVPKYTYKMLLGVGGSTGKSNNKLVWKGFWSYNRLTDDWAEFGLRNDRAFWFSRVGRWGNE